MKLYPKALVFAFGTLLAVVSSAQTAAPTPNLSVNRHIVQKQNRGAQAEHEGQSHAAQMAGLAKEPPLNRLPAFAVVSEDGSTSGIERFVKKGHWLLLYRPNHCPSCDNVMNAIANSTDPKFKEGAPYVVIVAGVAQGFDADVQNKYPQMKSATWLKDPKLEGEKALKIKVAPMLFGMRGSEIVWRVPGGLGSPVHVEGVATSWLNQEQRPTASTPVATGQTTP